MLPRLNVALMLLLFFRVTGRKKDRAACVELYFWVPLTRKGGRKPSASRETGDSIQIPLPKRTAGDPPVAFAPEVAGARIVHEGSTSMLSIRITSVAPARSTAGWPRGESGAASVVL